MWNPENQTYTEYMEEEMSEFEEKITDIDEDFSSLESAAESAGLPYGQYCWLNRRRRVKALKNDIANV